MVLREELLMFFIKLFVNKKWLKSSISTINFLSARWQQEIIFLRFARP
jgi:hypothetical protein